MSEKYPVIVHPYKINFYRCTNVKHVSGFNGHPYGFSFVGFEQILEGKADQALTVDVIGNVVWCGDLDILKREEKETKRINFDIEDLDGKVLRCTLWEGYAHVFNTFVSGHHSNEHVIVIIQHGKLKYWRGNKSIQNDMFGTRIFINENVDEINTLRKSFILKHSECSTSQSRLSSQTVYSLHSEFIINTERKYVDEIREYSKELVCVVLGTIKNVEEEYGWYYAGCPTCNKKVVSKQDYFADGEDISDEYEHAGTDTWWCKKCKCRANSVIPKFKLQVRVQDSTGSVSFVLFDREVNRIVGFTAAEIRERQLNAGDMESFPRELDVLVNKMFVFKIEVSKFNLKDNWYVYTVHKVCDDSGIIAEMVGDDPVDEAPEQSPGDIQSIKLSDDSQCVLDSKDAVSVTGDSLAVVDVEKDTGTSLGGKRPAEDPAIQVAAEHSTTKKRLRKRIILFDA